MWFQLHIICLFLLEFHLSYGCGSSKTEPKPAEPKPDALECLMETKRKGHNYYYSGTKNVTLTNQACKPWKHNTSLSNYCRQLDNDTEGIKPWCNTTDPEVPWEFCDIPMCAGNCLGPKVNEKFFFSGTHTVTKSGRPCQRWNESKPTKPYQTILALDMKVRTSMKNYCYTTESHEFPWCYVDSKDRWEDCANAECYTLERNCLGESINGNRYYVGTQNVTQSNKPCKRWDSLDSELLNYTNITKIYRGSVESLENYCRAIFSQTDAPSCFTGSNATLETCGIANCPDNCLESDIYGKYFYQGTQNVTATNKTCQRWDSVSLSVAYYRNISKLDNDTLASMENYCRALFNTSVPWCYTAETISTWEECGIKRCDDGSTPANNCIGPAIVNGKYYYNNTQNVTRSGKLCQRWDSIPSHKADRAIADIDNDTLKSLENYCVSLLTYDIPWCYTSDNDTTREECGIPACDGGTIFTDTYVSSLPSTDTCLGTFINGSYNYQGTWNVTSKGVPCRQWETMYYPQYMDNLAELKAKKNFCRASPLYQLPSCYTHDEHHLQYCDIPRCKDKSIPKKSYSKQKCVGPKIKDVFYLSGTKNISFLGSPCLPWDSPLIKTSTEYDPNLSKLSKDILKSMKNYCITTESDDFPYCMTIDKYHGNNKIISETCIIDDQCSSNCLGHVVDGQFYYRGTQNTTITGKKCQRWDSIYPHTPDNEILDLGIDILESMENFCRASTSYNVPWCYTNEYYTRREECGIPICDNCLGPLINGTYFYQGTQNKTKTGKICQRWDSTFPNFPDNYIREVDKNILKSMENFCRAPTSLYSVPWCYTTDFNIRREECGISKCDDGTIPTDEPLPASNSREPSNSRERDCLGPKVNKNFFFSGTQTVTKSGKQCQRWDASIPTVPKDPELLELDMETRKSMENYCYTSKSINRPWCYTMDKFTPREECDNAECYTIEKNCLGPIIDGKYFYQGTQHFTKSEKSCQRWDSLSSDVADSQILNFDNDTLKSMEDYCRTPLNYSVPGCYTAGPKSSWEECGIRVCDGDTCFVPLLDGKYYYRGTQNVTISEKNCQRWDSLSPDVAESALLDFDNGTLKSMENYCRTTLDYSLPGCYTSGPNSTWEGCDIQRCGRENCYRRNIDRQYKYQGTQNIPMNGKPCKRWDNLPDISMGVEVGLLFKHLSNHTLTSMENYCRPLFNGQAPFCFTEYPNDIDKNLYVVSCNIPRCEG